MESPNNMLLSKTSNARNSLHLVESSAKGDQQKTLNITADCQGYCCSSKSDDKALLLKATPNHAIKHTEVDLIA